MAAGERVQRERQRLDCPTCAVANRLAPGVLERGFQHCSHCGAAISVEGAGSYAVENTSAGFTRVISPGQSIFVLLLGRVLNLPVGLLFFLLGDLVLAAVRHLLAHWGGPRVVGWVLTGAFVAVCIGGLLLMFVEQRILVRQNRLETWWRLFGRRLRHRRFGTHGLVTGVRGGPRPGLVLKPKGGRPVTIRTGSALVANTLQQELLAAMEETRLSVSAETIRCPGCGSPVATPLEVLERGGVDCAHCGAGLMAVKGGVVLGPCAIHHSLKVAERPRRIARRVARDVLEWRLRPDLLARPGIALGILAVGWVLGGGMAAGGAGLFIASAPWRAFGAIFALIMVPLGLTFCCWATVAALGRTRARLDPTVLELTRRLGPLRVRRLLIPLARLLKVNSKEDANAAQLELKTALSEHEFDIPKLRGEGRDAALEILEGIRECVEGMGREVRWSRSQPPSSPQSRRSRSDGNQ